jgi:hypothetical protein
VGLAALAVPEGLEGVLPLDVHMSELVEGLVAE